MAIVYDSRSSEHIREYWSGATKERRRWLVDTIRKYDAHVQLMFVEVAADAKWAQDNLSLMLEREPSKQETVAHELRTKKYMQSYATLQTDGSEGDFSWMKLQVKRTSRLEPS